MDWKDRVYLLIDARGMDNTKYKHFIKALKEVPTLKIRQAYKHYRQVSERSWREGVKAWEWDANAVNSYVSFYVGVDIDYYRNLEMVLDSFGVYSRYMREYELIS